VATMKKQDLQDKARYKKRNEKWPGVVQVRHVSVPNIECRLSRAVDLLLKMVSTNAALQEGNLPADTKNSTRQALSTDATTCDDEC